ncbi:Pentraxin fusion protein [Liparis tanakae]|uniref:Pentraxin family member n=1 Tax=Liparis tanakae TaxID=230148 RepID=A0A4Z2HLD8_9TELE|nr:Pentraxin fusion protein [Liparis tanakae]
MKAEFRGPCHPSIFTKPDKLAKFASSAALRSLVFPQETSTSYVEMIPLKSMDLQAFTLCMRVATELKGKREVILFAYRTQEIDELNVWRELDGRLSLYMSGEGVLFELPQLGGLETHLCVSWDSISGATTFFLDGKKSLTKIYRKYHTVRPGGKIIIGQDADNYVGGFDAKQSFVGEISDINMWDFVLPEKTVRDVFVGKRVVRGEVLDWESAELKMHGNVQVMENEM